MKRTYKLEAGEKLDRSPNGPILKVVGGPRPYLWIGNDAKDDKMCFATLYGRESLAFLADAIHKTLDGLDKE